MFFIVESQIFSVSAIFADNYFGRLWKWYQSRWNQETPFLGPVPLTMSLQEASVVIGYLHTGEFEIENLEILITMLDFIGEPIPKKLDYPELYLQIKLYENWRRRFYRTELCKGSSLSLLTTSDVNTITTLYEARLHHFYPNLEKQSYREIDLTKYRSFWGGTASTIVNEAYRHLHLDTANLLPDAKRSYIKSYKYHSVVHDYGKDGLRWNLFIYDMFYSLWLNIPGKEELTTEIFSEEVIKTYINWERMGNHSQEELRQKACKDIAKFVFSDGCGVRGQAVLDAISNSIYKTKSYDLFFYATTTQAAERKIATIAALTRGRIRRTANSITIGTLKFSTKIYLSIEEALLDTTLDAEGVAYDGENLLATQSCIYSLGARVLFVDFDRYSTKYDATLAKFAINRLFSIYVPNLKLDLSNLTVDCSLGLNRLLYWLATKYRKVSPDIGRLAIREIFDLHWSKTEKFQIHHYNSELPIDSVTVNNYALLQNFPADFRSKYNFSFDPTVSFEEPTLRLDLKPSTCDLQAWYGQHHQD